MNDKPFASDGFGSSKISILLKNISFSYGDNKVLDEINLVVNSGLHIGIAGVSGGGKSTLLKILSGLYSSQSGVVMIEGQSSPPLIRKKTAMVMQGHMLFPASIKENITCGHPMSEELILRVCQAAQLSQWISTLPEGLDTFVGERGGKVSGGQAQRIAIARAMAKESSVVLLDEATSALDDDTASAVRLAVSNLTKDRTVVSVSHQPETLDSCDKIYRLEGGKLYET